MDDKAIESAEEILKINPNNLMALHLKSQYLEKNNQNAEAIQCLKKILMEEPSDLSIFLSLGRNYVEIGEFNQAEALYNLVLEIEPKNKAAIRLKSKLLKKKNNVTITSHDMMLKAVESFEMLSHFFRSISLYPIAFCYSPSRRYICARLFKIPILSGLCARHF
jgi:tetratricopeptide (TPR) repeat protein